MSYYAPFMRPANYYYPTMQNGIDGQNYANQGYANPITNTAPERQFTTQQPTNDMIWVLNENEATSYPVAPNNTVVMWDRNNNTAYIKSANAQGVPSMEILDYTKRSLNGSKSTELSEITLDDKFATKDEIIALRNDFDELRAMYDKLEKQRSIKIEEKARVIQKKSKESDE